MAFARMPLLILLAQQLLHASVASGEPSQSAPLSKYGTQICTGMVQAFLHRGDLAREEVDCMVSEVGDLALGAYESAESVASLFVQLSGLDGPGADGGVPLSPPLVVLRLAKSMQGLVHMLDGVMGSCVKGRSLELLTKAGDHLRNLTYVAGRLAANGADIVQELSDAMTAFKRDDYKRFGLDVGTACRKVLLSNASSEFLPEGPPSEEQLVNVSAGLLQGFFGAGFELTIASDKRIVTQPRKHTMEFIQDGFNSGRAESEVVVSQDKTRLNVHIDLHRCVSQNVGLFRGAVSKAWLYFAGAALETSGQGMGRFLDAMLLELPAALARCGVEPQQQAMLADSISRLRHVELRLQVPEDPASAGAAAKDLQAAAANWKNLSWFEFGTDLGRMLQGLLVEAHSDGYMLTGAGTLQKSEKAALTEKQLQRADKPSASQLAAGGFKSADELGAGSGLSVSGVQIVEGIAEGLLHRAKLSRSEGECLMKSVGSVLGGASKLVDSLADAVDELYAVDELFAASAAGAPPNPAQLLSELTRSFDGVARLAEGFMTTCRSDAAEAFQLSLQHLSSMSYVTGRIAANGADVQDGIDRAVASWKHGDPHAFGREVGFICRKVLLSSKSKTVLPEGSPALPDIVNASAGLLEGFFGKGFELDISSDRKIATMPLLPLAALMGGEGMEGKEAEAERLSIHIDLHTCVERNLPLFQSIVKGAGMFFALEEAAEPSPGMINTPFLMAMLARLPAALKKCGIDEEQEAMLMQSMEMLNSLHVKLQVPRSEAAADPERAMDHAAGLLKECVSDWSKLQWFALGKDLGKVLRETVLALLPTLYGIDGLGALRRGLLGLSDASPPETSRAAPKRLTSAGPALLAGALTLVAGLVVSRVTVAAWRRLGSSGAAKHAAAAGLEAGRGAEDFEAGPIHAGALE